MKKGAIFLFVLCITTSLFAQQGEQEPYNPPAKLPYANELGLRFGTQLGLSNRPEPELIALSIDYARYNYYNIGFRTGLNAFVGEINNYYSTPIQFTWRSNRLFSRDKIDNYANYDDRYTPASAGSVIGTILLYILPKKVELHTGFTPGMIFGSRGEAARNSFAIKHRFTATFDLGARLIIPIWRFNLFGDFTYHYYLTDNFAVPTGVKSPARSYMGIGVGLSFNF